MAPIPYGLLDRIRSGANPATEDERRQWIGQLRTMRPVPYSLIRDVSERPLAP
jgi:hypothetical protein